MKKYLRVLALVLSVCFTSCDKDDDQGVTIVLGCTDENAENYNANATDDNGTCTYSVSFLLDGQWNIDLLEYESEVDLSQIDPSILPEEFQTIWPLIVAGLGDIVNIEGEAEDAGGIEIIRLNNTYNQILIFETEPSEIQIPLVGSQEIPSIPIDINSSGTWILNDNEEIIIFTDQETNTEQNFEILTLTEDMARFKGNLNVPLDLEGFFSIDVDLDLDLQLSRVN
tara:strand:- start:4019 stop:4696 length:678 start_codon:yes stop_codon:yes gene_type:complete